ncbi:MULTISPECIES: flavin-containing monooxygenase [Pseudonocardia]|uniref:Pentalenolactone D synthase n=2 Tax=Pseudonocardia TaxID=1847 RepID=A0A1Y2N004_PSEAH|nr:MULTISPECIES: NAD(P)/FAD-dependent oxidoreductase [Pseudonocardia]OSY40752.1 Pentalenolactone D synthase [Pseudonocardia autotrophica]TDN71941.1 cyclohexanone monooxygenase [Pseudonocardia autotrophica]BBG02628.1 monooxygenase [Pseudonocardia autotrophica]GEC24687.1 monooxygenase [Pseudonocardia saturnea]
MSHDALVGQLDFDPDALKRRYDAERDKRIRPEGQGQYVGTGGKFAAYGRDPWADPDFRREPIRDHTTVIVAGGGFGGLLMGARLRDAGVTDVRIIEIGGDFGGTWYWNRYPGAMCDLEAHIYLPLLEELDYAPRHRYSYAPEILEHSQRIGKAYGLYDKALFQTTITGADRREDRWLLTTDRGDELTADHLVLACGRQSLPKLPNLPGIDRFAPHTFHSSRWDYAYTGGDAAQPDLTKLRDKRVGIIGTGATAIQIVPEVAKWAKELVVFQRTPSTVGVRGQCETPADWADTSRPGWQKARRENFQSYLHGLRPEDDPVGDGWTATLDVLIPETADDLARRLGRTPTAAELQRFAEINDYRVMNGFRDRIHELVTDPATADALTPWYRWWCKRPCFHDDYLPAFNRDNVRLVDTAGQGVSGFTETAVRVGTDEYEVDCLIFATGFEAAIPYTRLAGFDITARGVALSEHWRDQVRTLHGVATDGFPNLFFVGGNVQTAMAVNAVHLLDELAEHVAYVIARSREQGLVSVEPEPSAVDDYVAEIVGSARNEATYAFLAECTPGYYNGEGNARSGEDLFSGARYGDGALAYYDLLARWRAEGSMPGMTGTPR